MRRKGGERVRYIIIIFVWRFCFCLISPPSCFIIFIHLIYLNPSNRVVMMVMVMMMMMMMCLLMTIKGE